MTTPFQRDMAKATELTRAGKLLEATDLIRSLLQGSGAADQSQSAQISPQDVIDGEFTRLDSPTADPKPAAKPTVKPKAEAKPAPRAPQAKAVRSALSETLRKISAGGMPVHGPLSAAPTAAPGASFLSLTYASAQGSRDYRLYIPAKRPDGLMPLVVMLHGCTQSPEDFALGTGMNALAEEFGCLIAYPAQASGANAQKCWNWFRPEDQARGRGEPALIAGLTQDIQQAYPADPKRTYIAGLSAGGAAAALVAAAYPDVFAAVGVHSGLPAQGARDVGSAFAAMRSGTTGVPHRTALPTIVFHGLADGTVHPDNGSASLAQALAAMPKLRRSTRKDTTPGKRAHRVTAHRHDDGRSFAEHWEIDGAGHAWAGGHPKGSYTDPTGPDASAQMLRFFLQHQRP
jgi:poly(hydroxyalkanoate) depolymerase family esterase